MLDLPTLLYINIIHVRPSNVKIPTNVKPSVHVYMLKKIVTYVKINDKCKNKLWEFLFT